MRSRVRLSPLILVTVAAPPLLLLGCPPNVIEVGYYVPALDGGTTSSTGGTGGTGGGPLCTPGATQPCYDGPAGTEGMGLCKPGMQTCAADGSSWDACIGEVLPQTENCATPEDEDCDGKAPQCKGTLLWAKGFGGNGEQHATGIAVDSADNLLVAGYFNGAIDFGSGPLMSVGGVPGPNDVFVAKLDPTGGYRWAKSFGDADEQGATGIAVDASDNVVVTGGFSGSIDFGGTMLTSAGSSDAFVTKLDPTGALVWAKRFGAPSSHAVPFGVAVDGSGSVVVTGSFSGSIDFDGTMLTSAGSSDAFIAKLDSAGALVWAKSFGDTAYQTGASVAVDSAGGVLLLGYFGGSIDLGGVPLPSAGEIDAFLAKFDAAGNHAWSKSFGDGGANLQYATRVTVSAGGAPVSTGYFGGSIEFDGKPLETTANAAVFLAKLDAGGDHVWSEGFGNTGDQRAQGVTVDAVGNVVVCGGFTGQVDFGGGSPIASLGGSDVFMAKFNGDGDSLWSKRFGDASEQVCTGVGVDAGRNVVVTGDFAGSLQFGSSPLVSADGTDIFVAKFSE